MSGPDADYCSRIRSLPLSFLLLVAVHLPYVFTVPQSNDGERIIKFFLQIVTVSACWASRSTRLEFFVNPRFSVPDREFCPRHLYCPDTSIIRRPWRTARRNTGPTASSCWSPPSSVSCSPSPSLRNCVRWVSMTRLAIFGLALVVSYSGTGHHRARNLPAAVPRRAASLGAAAGRHDCDWS